MFITNFCDTSTRDVYDNNEPTEISLVSPHDGMAISSLSLSICVLAKRGKNYHCLIIYLYSIIFVPTTQSDSLSSNNQPHIPHTPPLPPTTSAGVNPTVTLSKVHSKCYRSPRKIEGANKRMILLCIYSLSITLCRLITLSIYLVTKI